MPGMVFKGFDEIAEEALLRREVVVEPGDPGSGKYDLFLASLGYEARSRYGLEQLAERSDRSYLSAFNSRQVHSFRDNLEVAAQLGSHVEVESDLEFAESVRAVLIDVCSKVVGPQIAFDISSSSRHRIASVVASLYALPFEVVCDLYYFPAQFRPPELEYGATLAIAGPVSPQFVGETVDPRRAIHVLLGLGYEGRPALGAVQYLEADEVWAFFPRSVDEKYDQHVAAFNEILLNEIDPANVTNYDVTDAFGCFRGIEAVVHTHLNQARPIVVPFGPKMFAACAMVASASYEFRLPVWRFSSGQEGVPVDAEADGRFACLRTTFLSRPDTKAEV